MSLDKIKWTNPYLHSILIGICFRRKKNKIWSVWMILIDSKIPKMLLFPIPHSLIIFVSWRTQQRCRLLLHRFHLCKNTNYRFLPSQCLLAPSSKKANGDVCFLYFSPQNKRRGFSLSIEKKEEGGLVILFLFNLVLDVVIHYFFLSNCISK